MCDVKVWRNYLIKVCDKGQLLAPDAIKPPKSAAFFRAGGVTKCLARRQRGLAIGLWRTPNSTWLVPLRSALAVRLVVSTGFREAAPYGICGLAPKTVCRRWYSIKPMGVIPERPERCEEKDRLVMLLRSRPRGLLGRLWEGIRQKRW